MSFDGSSLPDRSCKKKLSWSDRADDRIYHLPHVDDADRRIVPPVSCCAVTWTIVSSGFLLLMLLMFMLAGLGEAQ